MDLDDEDYRAGLTPHPCRVIKPETIAACEFSDYINFEWDRVGEALRKTVRGYIDRLHEVEKLGYGIMFHGTKFGHGKTSLAVQCALEAMRRGPVGGYFYELGDMSVLFSQPWNHLTLTGKPVSKKLLDVQFLVLDEIDDKITQPKNKQWFKQVIRHRYNKKLVTFITTNYDPSFFQKEFPWFSAILAERFQIIEVNDQNQRILNAKQNIHLTSGEK